MIFYVYLRNPAVSPTKQLVRQLWVSANYDKCIYSIVCAVFIVPGSSDMHILQRTCLHREWPATNI